MGLFKKFTDLVKSNANAAVNAAEDPKKLVDQAIADMQAQLKDTQKKRLEVATLAKPTEKQVAAHAAVAIDWERKATAAIKIGNEDLARAALTEKATVDALITEASTTLDLQRRMVEDISTSIATLEGGIETAKKKRAELMTRLAKAESKQRENEAKGVPGKDHLADTSAFETFDRMNEKIEHTEAEVEAAGEIAQLGGNAPVPLETSRQLAAATADDALAALKAKMGKG